MGAESIEPEGIKKLLNIIKDKEKDIKRFKEGFLLIIERNAELKTITEYEAQLLRMTLQTMEI